VIQAKGQYRHGCDMMFGVSLGPGRRLPTPRWYL
jgi:hypothetical protein